MEHSPRLLAEGAGAMLTSGLANKNTSCLQLSIVIKVYIRMIDNSPISNLRSEDGCETTFQLLHVPRTYRQIIIKRKEI